MKKKIIHIVGARPNFMKLAPLWRALAAYPNVEQKIVHTGQHYDAIMSDDIFNDLELPKPDANFRINPADIHVSQIAKRVITELTSFTKKWKPDIVVVYGDTNSTLAGALATKKLDLKLAHIEAGLRSFDLNMPEEHNRIIVDHISNYHFTTSPEAKTNLATEGIGPQGIFFVGNIMIDSLHHAIKKAKGKSPVKTDRAYALVTLHRPSNVDTAEELRRMQKILQETSRHIPVVFPVHPRTEKLSKKLKIRLGNPFTGEITANSVYLLPPLSYFHFVSLYGNAKLVMTDSGGIQEETSVLGIPCITLRENTERPVTVTHGTNTLVGSSIATALKHVKSILAGTYKKGGKIKYWDGKAGERIARKIVNLL